MRRHFQRAARREQWRDQLQFPLNEYRPGQQAIARRVYQNLRAGESLLLEAPTGSGKSLAVLYPAVRGQQRDDQFFFLTSRGAGAAAALTAAELINSHQPGYLSVVEIRAKEKVCPVAGMPCRPELCEYASGYFDRRADAIDALCAHGIAHSEDVQAVAEEHTVCPFELSLDAAQWADVIIGDYNYIFDPMVRLQRFVGNTNLHLLIDEAHQIAPRVRDMLRVSIDRDIVKAVEGHLPELLRKRCAAIDRALMKVRRSVQQGQHVVDEPVALIRSLDRLMECVAELQLELAEYPEFAHLYFCAVKWQRSAAWRSPGSFAYLATVEGRGIELAAVCIDPAAYLKTVFAQYGANVRFSGTLTPLALYQRLHGQDEGHSERAPNPFQASQTEVLIVRDIPTYFRQREESLPRLAQLVLEVVTAHPGKYLVALPSYAYLAQLTRILDEMMRGDVDGSDGIHQPAAWDNLSDTQSINILQQQSGMRHDDLDELLRRLADHEQGVLFIVMGGSLGESVDFSGINLQGVIAVGLGLPPPDLEKALQIAHFDDTDGEGWGQMVAYTQPALTRILQAVGRLIRSPDDRGVICLVDPRFTRKEVAGFFPVHWRPRQISASQAAQAVTGFWQKDYDFHQEPGDSEPAQ